MTRRYAALVAGVVALALSLAVLGRLPHAQEATARVSAPAPVITRIDLEVRDGAIVPGTVTVPKGERVLVRVTNRTSLPVRIALLGYADVYPETAIAAGETRGREIFADRPGEDFAWLLNGSPAGTLIVAGSHLVDGHQ